MERCFGPELPVSKDWYFPIILLDPKYKFKQKMKVEDSMSAESDYAELASLLLASVDLRMEQWL